MPTQPLSAVDDLERLFIKPRLIILGPQFLACGPRLPAIERVCAEFGEHDRFVMNGDSEADLGQAGRACASNTTPHTG